MPQSDPAREHDRPGPQPAPAHVLAERGQRIGLHEARLRDERALAVHAVDQPAVEERIDGAAYRHARHAEALRELALRRQPPAGPQPRHQALEDLLELRTLGAVGGQRLGQALHRLLAVFGEPFEDG